MQEHPVPQNITSYEFHLIGNMTLKQFLELAAGGALAFLTYSSNLPGIIKWPVLLGFVSLGGAMAFLPIEERPLDTWLLAFIRAIYNPTKFHWKKTVHVPDFFSDAVRKSAPVVDDVATLTKPQRASRVAAYFQSISDTSTTQNNQEDLLQRALSITQMYDSVPAAADVRPATKQVEQVEKPSVQVHPHQLKAPAGAKSARLSGTITVTSVTPAPQEANVTLPNVVASQNLVSKAPVEVKNVGKAPLAVDTTPQEEELVAPTRSKTSHYQAVQTTIQPTAEENLQAVQTSQSLPFPKTPTTPNVVVGMVLDKDGKILENAIVEIRTIQGFPARALKSNRLGQFFASTPLPAGEYEIIIEKDGYMFAPQKLSIANKVIAPLEIRAN